MSEQTGRSAGNPPPRALDLTFVSRIQHAALGLMLVGALCLLGATGRLEAACAWAGGWVLGAAGLEGIRRMAMMLHPGMGRVPRWWKGLLIAKVPVLGLAVWLVLGPLRLPAVWFLAGYSLVPFVIVLKTLGRGLTHRQSAGGAPLGDVD